MSDVRLTATDPSDSSVVPVACNAKGELLLEAPPDYSFDGNLSGNLSVSGTSNLSGNVDIGNGSISLNAVGSIGASSEIRTSRFGTSVGMAAADDAAFRVGSSADTKVRLGYDGSVEFAGRVDIGGGTAADDGYGVSLRDGQINIRNDNGTPTPIFSSTKGGTAVANARIVINNDGSVIFAGGTAGFTGDGHLWCTTISGDTYVLDTIVGGKATWSAYTPSTNKEDLLQGLENIKNDNIASSQDNTET